MLSLQNELLIMWRDRGITKYYVSNHFANMSVSNEQQLFILNLKKELLNLFIHSQDFQNPEKKRKISPFSFIAN